MSENYNLLQNTGDKSYSEIYVPGLKMLGLSSASLFLVIAGQGPLDGF